MQLKTVAINCGFDMPLLVVFANITGDYIRLHKPHPRNILKLYQIDDIIANLTERGLL